MPLYTDPATGKKIRSDEPLSDADLEEAFGGKADDSTALGRAASYVGQKVMDTGMAASRLSNPSELSRPWTDTASDALTAGAPFVAPGLTLAGTAVGAGTRAAGGGEDVADLANAATQVGGGLLSAGKAVAGLKDAIDARYAAVAQGAADKGLTLVAGSEQGQTVKAALERALERFAPGSTERHVAEGVLAKLAPEAGSTPFSGGGLTYQQLDDALTNVQDVNKKSVVAGILRTARNSLVRGTPEAGGLKSAIGASRRAGMSLPAKASLGGGALGAYQEAKRGNYGKAAASLALGATGASASVGHLLAAAGPLARAGVGAASAVKPSLTGDSGNTADDTAPDTSAPTPQTAPESPTEAGTPAAPRPQPAVPGRYGRAIGAVAGLVGIPAPVIQTFMAQESGGNPNALSHPEAGQAQTPAHGLMQITPGTFEAVRGKTEALLGRPAHLDNPLDNLIAGGLLLRRYLDMSGGDLRTTAKMYFGGESPTGWGARTHQYGEDIVNRFSRVASAAQPPPAAPAPAPTAPDQLASNSVLPDYPGGEAQHAHDRALVLGDIP